jgi:hypothetical protein
MDQIAQLAFGQHAPWFWSLVLTTSVGTAVLNQLVQAARDHRSGYRKASYLALRLAVTLERFALECLDVAGDLQLHKDSHGAAGKLLTAVPDIYDYPDEPDAWYTLDKSLAERAIALRSHRDDAQAYTVFESQFDNHPLGRAETAATHSALVGEEAWMVASALRKKYRYRRYSSRIPLEASLVAFAAEARKRRDGVSIL